MQPDLCQPPTSCPTSALPSWCQPFWPSFHSLKTSGLLLPQGICPMPEGSASDPCGLLFLVIQAWTQESSLNWPHSQSAHYHSTLFISSTLYYNLKLFSQFICVFMVYHPPLECKLHEDRALVHHVCCPIPAAGTEPVTQRVVSKCCWVSEWMQKSGFCQKVERNG